MEQYIIDTSNTPTIAFGDFYDEIHSAHIESYGQEGADNIKDNVRSTYISLIKQLSDSKNHNSLLVGKVQSGKTSNLELLTALAFDNGYNFLVVYGGYDTDLLKQTTVRYGQTFKSDQNVLYSETPALFTTGEVTNESNSIDSLSVNFASEVIEEGRKIIISCLKRPDAMKKVNKLISDIVHANVNIVPFIIDDEGDQASLNTKKDKKNDATPTYNEIRRMKKLLGNPLYLSVTATPQANIFQSQYSELIPYSVHLIQPGNGYDGASVYHLSENDIIEEVDDMNPSDGNAFVWRDSILYFIVASAIKTIRARSIKEKQSDMIIHEAREKTEHGRVYSKVNSYISNLKESFSNEDDDVKIYYTLFEECYNRYLTEAIKSQYPFDDVLKSSIKQVIKSTDVILQNSVGKKTKAKANTTRYKIYIGGDLLQRGLTFPHLITTYFTRWASKGGNMDTNMQRARWFGYREKYIDLCKIFTTVEIAKEFTNLADIEEDLWDQFADVESGILRIEDIIVRAEDTKQKPTARNKANYGVVTFKQRWIKQRFIVKDDAIIEYNNAEVDKIIKAHNWELTTVGSRVDEPTAKFTYMRSEMLRGLISSIDVAFDMEPFQKKALLDIVGEVEIPVIAMWTNEDKTRFRSVYNENNPDRIKALHQGANSTIVEKIKYEGDSKVLIDPNKVNIQIHYVKPGYKKDGQIVGFGKDQYMFAIYIPKDKKYYIKNND